MISSGAFFFFLSLSLSLSLYAHTPSHPPSFPIETGYQSYLLNLMHALSTHSHPVTSPLNIETGFSGITRTSISQSAPPLPTTATPSLWPVQNPAWAPNSPAPNQYAPGSSQPHMREEPLQRNGRKKKKASANSVNLLFNGKYKQWNYPILINYIKWQWLVLY